MPPKRRGIGGVRRWFRDGPLRRIFRNAGIMVGGRTVAALLDLGAFTLTARTLGPGSFGVLVMVVAYAQLISGLAKFQSWQAVIHFGSRCLEQGRRADFQGLILFTALLDLAGAVVGGLIALTAAPLVGAWLDWDGEAVRLAMLCSLLVLTTLSATPTGILRLFDRFDLLAAYTALIPGLRLVGATLAYLAGAGLAGFVVVWVAAGVGSRLCLLALGWRELARQGFTRDIAGAARRMVAPHPGLWRFVWTSNLTTTVSMVTERSRPLIVGWLLGPAAVGVFEVAQRFAEIIVKPVANLGQTIYPELARLSSRDEPKAVRKLAVRAAAVAGSAGLLAFAALAAAGPLAIHWTVGDAYAGAYGLLVLLALASAIAVFAFPIAPILYATGRPHVLLRVTVVVNALHVALLALFLGWIGLLGVGIAALASTTVSLVILTVITVRWFARRAAPAAP